MDKQPMDINNEVVKTNSMQELSLDDMNKVSGGKKVKFYTVCRVCGGIKDDPAAPDDLKCHCQ